MRINFNDLTAVHVGMSYLVHNLGIRPLWKVLPLFEKKDATIIDGIAMYSKADGDYETEPFTGEIQLRNFKSDQYVNTSDECKVGYKIYSSFELKNAEAMLLHSKITDQFAEDP